MAWATPPTWAAGNVATSAKLTVISGDLTYLEAPYEAWTSYTPTLTQSGAVTKTVTYAKYAKFGRAVRVNVTLTITGSGTGANAVVVGLPVTAATSNQIIGSGIIYDASASSLYKGHVNLVSTTTVQFYWCGDNTVNSLGVVGFTAGLASTDQVQFSASYESAT